MNDERERVKEKIKALLAKTIDNGCSEHEAMSAATKAAELMEHYDIQATELDYRDNKCIQKKVTIRRYNQRRVGNDFAAAIARLCDCQFWWNIQGKTWYNDTKIDNVVFFGFEQDAEVAAYLYETIANACMSEMKAYQQTDDYKAEREAGESSQAIMQSFLTGMEYRIHDRLHSMRRAKKDKVVKATGTALVELKEARVSEEKEGLGYSWSSVSTGSRGQSSSGGFSAGHSAGGRIGINPGVTAEETRRLA